MASGVGVTVEIGFSRPTDLRSSLSGFGRWGDDLIDRFDGRRLIRSASPVPHGPLVAYSADVADGLTDRLTVAAVEASDLGGLSRAVAATFVVDSDALRALSALDPAVAGLAARYPGHVPVLVQDPFHALVRSISAQQVNLSWASTTRRRLALRYGVRLDAGGPDSFVHALRADALAEATVAQLRQLQLTNAKARSVIAVARAARDGYLDMQTLSVLDDEQLIGHLTALPGIGRWSAEWFLARTLGRPRVVAGDLGVRKAVGRLYGVALPAEADVRRLTEHWGPAAAVAQALALHDLAVSPVPAPAR
jgi:DNA-3-methyladenine glycosylase II